jgi:hypothetical protein
VDLWKTATEVRGGIGDDAATQSQCTGTGGTNSHAVVRVVASRMYVPIWRSDRSASGTIGAAIWNTCI